MGLLPGPQLDQRVQPEVQMIYGDTGPVVTLLFFHRPMHFLEVVKVMLDGGTVGDRLQNLRDRRRRLGAEERGPAVVFPNQDHADQAPGRRPGGQECLVRLEDFFAVEDKRRRLPTVPMARALGQAERLLALLGFPPPLPGLPRARPLPYP